VELSPSLVTKMAGKKKSSENWAGVSGRSTVTAKKEKVLERRKNRERVNEASGAGQIKKWPRKISRLIRTEGHRTRRQPSRIKNKSETQKKKKRGRTHGCLPESHSACTYTPPGHSREKTNPCSRKMGEYTKKKLHATFNLEIGQRGERITSEGNKKIRPDLVGLVGGGGFLFGLAGRTSAIGTHALETRVHPLKSAQI